MSTMSPWDWKNPPIREEYIQNPIEAHGDLKFVPKDVSKFRQSVRCGLCLVQYIDLEPAPAIELRVD